MTSSLPSRLLGRVVSMSTVSTVDRMNFSRVFQDCSALNAGKQAHARMILSGFIPTLYVTNCLIHMYIRCSDLVRAAAVFDVMPERDTVSWNAMIFGYAASGDMLTADSFFEMMPRRDVVSWNSMMSGYMKNGSFWDSVMTFARMRNLDPQDSSAYILLSNIYADAGMWKEVTKIRRSMRYKKLKKEPGCSWIEVKNEVHAFLAADKAHRKAKEIYETLNILIQGMVPCLKKTTLLEMMR
uniref:Pentatricopeptide repeat-containing protein n=1 Tax=Kalanchoe fedtschenkoi TaxID=63787 RepID=A0A7N0VDW5_KALFE